MNATLVRVLQGTLMLGLSQLLPDTSQLASCSALLYGPDPLSYCTILWLCRSVHNVFRLHMQGN